MNAGTTDDPQRRLLQECLEGIQRLAEKATCWRHATVSLRDLLNNEGVVPVRARLAPADLDFLEVAREETLTLARLGLRLLDLHRPRDAGGISSDPANPIQRCRSCMWRWPCPTFRAISESLDCPWQRRKAEREARRAAEARAAGEDGGDFRAGANVSEPV